ncbi:MAG TPA: metal-sensing transcriptional repressor [Clostridiales bacterium]|jgi:DNA-binding FrmR family transcriptional regulator|nr:metal-sensing transcriptional repressor [Clostridiales bacterium]
MGHTHIGPDGKEFVHTHDELHSHEGQEHKHHGHVHTPEENRAVINRISRAIGHLESIKKMVESGRDCSEVLIQLSAVKSAINNVGKVILKNHIEHCLVEAVQSGEWEIVEELLSAVDRFIK